MRYVGTAANITQREPLAKYDDATLCRWHVEADFFRSEPRHRQARDIIREEMRDRHPGWDWEAIDKRQVKVGMEEFEVACSIGQPNRINRSSHGPDQWVYNRLYVYFRNGVVDAWQEY
jgi:hypothetical protein